MERPIDKFHPEGVGEAYVSIEYRPNAPKLNVEIIKNIKTVLLKNKKFVTDFMEGNTGVLDSVRSECFKLHEVSNIFLADPKLKEELFDTYSNKRILEAMTTLED